MIAAAQASVCVEDKQTITRYFHDNRGGGFMDYMELTMKTT